MPRLPVVSCVDAVKAFERAGWSVKRWGNHIIIFVALTRTFFLFFRHNFLFVDLTELSDWVSNQQVISEWVSKKQVISDWVSKQQDIMTKSGSIVSLSIPNHREIAKGTLRKLIRLAGLTVDDFTKLLS